jgi:uncharacterized membrane protein YfcA
VAASEPVPCRSVSITTLTLLGLGGILAGFMNTVAGGGSVITIPILVEAVGASVANGSLRIALIMQNVVGLARYQRGDAVPWNIVARLAGPTVVGSAAGAWTASQLSAGALKRVFAVAVVLVALSVVLKPSQWVPATEPSLREPLRSIVFTLIGFYGGFVQAGVGFLFLVVLVPGMGLGLVRGNAVKVALILAYTPVALLVFASASQVNWEAGVAVGIGSMAGAWLAASLAVKKGAGWIRWVLVVAAAAAAARMLFA